MTDLLHDDQVRSYLADLDINLKSLPPTDATRLRSQIIGHIDEAIGPSATEEEIADALRRLGTPTDLVVEYLASPEVVATTLEQRRAAKALRRMRLRRLAVLVAFLAVVAGCAGFGYSVDHTAPLEFNGGGASWWYSIDARHSYTTSAGNIDQDNAPVRVGKQQGFVIEVYNPSRWTQTVLGAAEPESDVETRSVSVEIALFSHGIQPPMMEAHYRPEASIPPHQWAFLREIWTTGDCDSRNSSDVINGALVRVRVGWFTRTEIVDFGPVNFALVSPATTPYRLHCDMNP